MSVRKIAAPAALAAVAVIALLATAPVTAQHSHGSGHAHDRSAAPATPDGGAPAGAAARTRAPVRITMDELHALGGVPRGWRFTLPPGDPKKGREVFARLECYQCHEVKGESFPVVPKDPKRTGPPLSGMGDHHPAEYLAESLVNPNAVIVLGPGHTGPDGLSIMPDYRESITLAEWVDVVAYMKSLTGGVEHRHDEAPAAEKTVGDYRVRLAYHAPGGGHGGHGGHGSAPSHAHGSGGHAGPSHGSGAHQKSGHLMVFVTDAQTGDPVPYLPVTVTVLAEKAAPRTVTLAPMIGAQGFHYGADVTLPASTRRLAVSIGKASVRVMPSAGGRFTKPATVSFDWEG